MGLIGQIGNAAKKLAEATKPKVKALTPEQQRERDYQGHLKELEHRERMLAAEDVAKAKARAEVRAAGRAPKRVIQIQPKAPAPKPQTMQQRTPGFFDDLVSAGGGGGLSGLGLEDGGGGGHNPMMEDLGNFGSGGGRGRAPGKKGSGKGRPQKPRDPFEGLM